MMFRRLLGFVTQEEGLRWKCLSLVEKREGDGHMRERLERPAVAVVVAEGAVKIALKADVDHAN